MEICKFDGIQDEELDKLQVLNYEILDFLLGTLDSELLEPSKKINKIKIPDLKHKTKRIINRIIAYLYNNHLTLF